MSRRWVRLYADILDDPKIAQMSPKTFKFFMFLLVFCAENGKNNTILEKAENLRWRFRNTKEEYEEAVDELIDLKIISLKNNNIVIKKWDKRQYKSDVSTERVKRFRNASETQRKRSGNIVETPPDTDTDTEQKKKKYKKENVPINSRVAYELAVKQQYDNAAIYYARKSISDWDAMNEVLRRNRFISAYDLATKQIEAGEVDLLEYDLLIQQNYKNPFGDKTVECQAYENLYYRDYDCEFRAKLNSKDVKIINPKGKILLVEDDPISRKMIKYFLEQLNYDVCIAIDVWEALKLYGNVDLILLDISLPKIDGLEFCKRVRKVEGDQEIPIIGMTALTLDLEQKAKDAGLTAFYQKPLLQNDLEKILNKYWTNAK